MFEPAPAKINLTLHVTGRRADGYHLLDSLVVFAGAHDRLQAEPSDELSLALTGPFAAGLSAEPDNLVLRAARALAQAAGVHAGARLTLEKHLPIASGIGGGSSDAAAALRLLGQLWGVRLQPDDLHELAGTLGADVPVCCDLQPARMEGIGEILSAAPGLPACGIVLINPGIALATAAVFRARAGDFRARAALPPSWKTLTAMVADLAMLGNDLEAPAVGLCPEIGGLLAALRARSGCRLARMSGSGATCFGLFDTAADAAAAAATLARPSWWCWGGGLWQFHVREAQPLYGSRAAT